MKFVYIQAIFLAMNMHFVNNFCMQPADYQLMLADIESRVSAIFIQLMYSDPSQQEVVKEFRALFPDIEKIENSHVLDSTKKIFCEKLKKYNKLSDKKLYKKLVKDAKIENEQQRKEVSQEWEEWGKTSSKN